ncbi:hypothetical protein [Leifsonia sp. Le1]|uniref:hypothetical protein n=1 Tax=Leifsonia sp. Le1 TaxID=3404918 RepID=UPI003EBE2F5C
MTIPNDDSTPEQPTGGNVPPAPDAGGAVPPVPPAPPASPVPPAAPVEQTPPTQAPGYPSAAASGGFPAYSAAPSAPAPAAPTEPPSQITIAFWLYIAAAVLSVISGIVTAISVSANRDTILQQITDSLAKSQTNGAKLDPNTLTDAAITFGIVWAVVTLIFWALVFVLFAVFMRRGRNWARIVLTVLTVISLLNLGGLYFIGGVQVIAAIVATILIWLKPASQYFAAVKASRAPRA